MATNKLIIIDPNAIEALENTQDVLRFYQASITALSEALVNMQDRFLEADYRRIGDAINRASAKTKDHELVHLFGKIKGAVELYASVLRSVSFATLERTRAKDDGLMDILSLLTRNNGPLTHGELARKLQKSPSALSMSLKRHPYWWDYIINIPNPDNPKSSFLAINLRGKKLMCLPDNLGTRLKFEWATDDTNNNRGALSWQH